VFLNDAMVFLEAFEEGSEISIPHIYLSALPFLDSTSMVPQEYRHTFSRFPVANTGSSVQQQYSIPNPHGGFIYVMFSADEKSIISSSENRIIHVWDVKTGELAMQPFEGHTDTIWWIAISVSNLALIVVVECS